MRKNHHQGDLQSRLKRLFETAIQILLTILLLSGIPVKKKILDKKPLMT